MMKIMITAASSAGAYRLERLLQPAEKVFFADHADLPQIASRSFVKIPRGDSPSFAHELLGICLDLEIQAVYPLNLTELAPLAEARQLFAEYGISVAIPAVQELALLLPPEGELIKGPLLVANGEVLLSEEPVTLTIPPAVHGIFKADTLSGNFYVFTAG